MNSRTSHPHLYDSIGHRYRTQRTADRRIAAQIRSAIGEAVTVCNVGAGAGSYEPEDLRVTAVEPSWQMISQHPRHDQVVRACAETLPFHDDAFDVAMTVLSVHHWEDATRGLHEMRRVARRQVVFTFDPDLIDSLWLVRDYLPQIIDFERERAQPIAQLVATLGGGQVEKVLIPADCTDGFQAAYWRRPREYLKPAVQAAISTFAQLPPAIVTSALQRLRRDLESGHWDRTYGELTTKPAMDFGYRLVTSLRG